MSSADEDFVDVIPPASLGVILSSDLKTRHSLNEKDRFGFPLHASLLTVHDLRPQLEDLARDAVAALIRLLGPDEARDVMSKALKQANTGKKDNGKENQARLAAYDNEIAAGTNKRHAARRAAENLSEGRHADVESIAKHIRGLVKDRDKRQSRAEKEQSQVKAWCERFGPSLLTRGADDRETEL